MQGHEQFLNETVTKKSKVFYIIKKISNSKNYQNLDFYVINDNDLVNITRSMAHSLNYFYKDNTNCIGVSGGLEIPKRIIRELSNYLFGSYDLLESIEL